MSLQVGLKIAKNLSLPFNYSVNGFVRSPLNYIGGKFKTLNQILPHFPTDINNFVDLFAGGGNVGINADARKIYFNDNLVYLIEMYKVFQANNIEETVGHIENRIKQFNLSLTNEAGYRKIRNLYNKEKNPLDLFVLIAYSFNHQIRFNSKHEFNNPFGKERSNFNCVMERNLKNFIFKLQEKQIDFFSKCFEDFDFSFLTQNDFVYCDPPYLITTGTYNDGKRGFKGWTEREEIALLKILDMLDDKKIRFALSNVLEHKGKSNDVLKDWVKRNSNYRINFISCNYANSNYHTIIKDKNASVEVLITNYKSRIQSLI